MTRMEYQIVELQERTVVGLGTRVKNDAPDMVEKIGNVWNQFMSEGLQKLHVALGTPTFGIYTNYDWAEGSYDMIAACQSDVCPEEFRKVTIPAGKYAKFSFRGDVKQATADMWGKIWNEPLPRACAVDFEEYSSVDFNGQGDISIYIGLADVCQACGMPMTKKEQYGTEADGTASSEYCCYCYQKGKFTADCTMEEMINFCLDTEEGKKMYTDRDVAKKQMMEYFPTLKRWRK